MTGLNGKKLLSRSEFATLAGVSPAAITKACKAALVPACSGSRIDAEHPAALKYVADRAAATTGGPAIGIDPLYEKAVSACIESGRYTARAIRSALSIGTDRSNRIFAQLKAAGLVPPPREPEQPPPLPPPPPPPPPEERPRVATVASRRFERLTREATLRDFGVEDDEPLPRPSYPEEILAFLEYTVREILDLFGTTTAFQDWLDATKTIEMIEEKRIKNAVSKGELISRVLVKNNLIDPINSAHIKMLTDGAKTITQRVTSMHGAGTPIEEIEKFVIDNISSFLKPVKAKIARALENV